MNYSLLLNVDASWSDFWNSFVSWLAKVNWGNFCFYVCLVFLFVALVLVLVSFIVENKRHNTYLEDIKEETSTIRIYRIDGPRNAVRFFNLSDISKVKTISLNEFFAGSATSPSEAARINFPEREQPRVKEWISSILDGRASAPYLQTDIIIHHPVNHPVPSFMKISKADPSKGFIHLESYLLRYGSEASEKPTTRHYSTEGDFAQAVKANGTATGITFCFALLPSAHQKAQPAGTAPSVAPEILERFQNAIAPFAKGKDKLIQASSTELIIANFDMIETSQAINFALRVVNVANRKLIAEKKRHEPSYEVRVGVVSNKDLLGDSDAILSEARRAASSNYDLSSTVSFYKKGSEELDQGDVLNYRSEVERIIYEKRLVYSYRPVYALSKKAVMGYLGRATPLNTSFASIEELKNYAVRAKDDKNLFAAIGKNLVPRFVNERLSKNQILFYPVRMNERSFLVPFFSHFKDASVANLVFVFSEADVAVALDSAGLSRFLEELDEIKAAGYGIAFLVSDKTLLLDSKVYAKADDFFVDFSSNQDETSMDTKIRSELHALVEKLLKYEKPIVANNLMSWNAIELVVGSGIAYVSSDAFAPYDTMFRPLNDKNVERLVSMRKGTV